MHLFKCGKKQKVANCMAFSNIKLKFHERLSENCQFCVAGRVPKLPKPEYSTSGRRRIENEEQVFLKKIFQFPIKKDNDYLCTKFQDHWMLSLGTIGGEKL